MEGSSNLVLIILLLGATQGLFLTLLLLTKPINKPANRLLAFLIIAYSAFIVEQSLSSTQFVERYPHIQGLAAGVVFLNGPLHYLYALMLIRPGASLTRKHLLHFIPFVVFYLYFLFPVYLKSGPEKIAFMQSIAEHGLTPALMIASWAVLIQGVAYMVVTFGMLQRHSEVIKNTFSSIEKINLNWLKHITFLTLVIWILGVIIEFLQMYELNDPVQATVPISLTVLIYVMGYLGLRQPEIFSHSADTLSDAEVDETGDTKKYERSGLTREKAQQLDQKLVHLMEIRKPFTDSSLKLNHLAQMVSTSPNYLSQVINEERQQNFYDFVNSYRIEEAKRMILDPSQEQMTLLSIAYEVGFNSKSAFNTAFKKHTGMTPTQLKKTSS